MQRETSQSKRSQPTSSKKLRTLVRSAEHLLNGRHPSLLSSLLNGSTAVRTQDEQLDRPSVPWDGERRGDVERRFEPVDRDDRGDVSERAVERARTTCRQGVKRLGTRVVPERRVGGEGQSALVSDVEDPFGGELEALDAWMGRAEFLGEM